MVDALPVSLAILTLIAICTLIANRAGTPAPVLQTAVGIALGFLPVVPHIDLPPRLVMLGVLPPLVYAAAVELPWEEFRDNLRPISALAFGLVAATVAAVAVAAHLVVPGLSWMEAVVLGAIVSPTDPVASTAVAARLGVPRRLVAIIEGEGLVNDAVSLTVYRLALAALAAGAFAIGEGALRFVVIVAGEIVYGSLVGWIFTQLRRRLSDARVEITVSLITPFAAYLVPEALGGSGVLATVAAGMYIGEQAPEVVPSATRLHLTGVWDMIIYVLNGALFLLTGLQFRSLWNGESEIAALSLLWYGAAVSAVVIVARFAWIWPAAWASRIVFRRLRERDPMPSHRHLAFVSWSGMRGGISLAAAFSIPMVVHTRGLILVLTACVIAATLLLQGVTLPFVIRLLRLDREAQEEEREARRDEAIARRECVRAALEVIDGARGAAGKRLQAEYQRWSSGLADADSYSREEVTLEKTALEAERRCVIRLHREGKISEEVMRRIERDVDLREALVLDRLERIR